jgi:CheY-like chemotaxis protein
MQEHAVKMLVADDSTAIRRIFSDVAACCSMPIRTFEAANGRECMELLGSGDIDLAFVDVFMPEMFGLEALSDARVRGSKTFVTLMSSRPDERCIELARELHAYEFLTKPFAASEIEAVIATYGRLSTPMRGLIVDDSATVRSVIHRVLDRSIFHIDIAEAAGGEAALQLCRTGAFDILLMDCNMPGLDGIETLRLLRDTDPDIRVVMISGERNDLRERDAFKAGAVAFLRKPFNPRDIDDVFHRVFGLISPRLTITRPGVLKQFDVAISGRTIAIAHKDSGHLFQYLWFRDPPHLRSTQIRPNNAADQPPGKFRGAAEKAGILELKHARLVA